MERHMNEDVLTTLAKQLPPAEVAAQLRLPPGPLKLRRAWPRSADHLLLEYEAPGPILVPGQWHRERLAAERALARVSAGFAAMYDLQRAPGTIVLQLRGADRRLRGLSSLLSRPEASLLVHQPERRAVVRLAERGETVYAKVVRPERAHALAAAGAAAHTLGGDAFDAPRLLATDEAAGVLVWSGLPGVALYELRKGAALERGTAAAGKALRALHAATPMSSAPAHGPDAERATLERWIGLVSAFDAATGARVTALAPAVCRALGDGPTPAVLIHRDFYDRQILVTEDGRIGLLDFDTLARGEPALDLANALVHLELRALQGLVSLAAARRAQRALIGGYQPDRATRARLGVYVASTRLRLACVYSFRPRWRDCIAALLWN